MHYAQLQLYKSMKESVNEFTVYNKFVTGSSSTQQTFFMETRNALRAAFISPESNDNLTRAIAALPESRPISSEGMLIFNTSVSSTGLFCKQIGAGTK